MKQGILQGKGHGWWGQLGEATTVDKPDNRMNKAGGMDGNFQLFGRKVEQPSGLDQFESFVGHGGRIDCNFLSHRPIRVIKGLLEGYVFELLDR